MSSAHFSHSRYSGGHEMSQTVVNPRPTSPLPVHTRDWFVSEWNNLASPERTVSQVTVHDTTLRDGEQQAGLLFTATQKLRIAERLAGAGVQRIEAGMPAVSPEDESAIRMIVRAGLPSEIYVLSRCQHADVQRAVDCGVDGVVMEIPSSRQLIENGYRWSVERAVELCVEATGYAAEQGLKVSFFPVDASRANIEEFLGLIATVSAHGHMDSLGLVDTFGVLTPEAVKFYTERCRSFEVPLEAHFHMDFGLGVANTLAAVGSGASVVHTTVGGIGERAGNTPLEETALALETLYGIDSGIDTTQLKALHSLVYGFAGLDSPPSRPVVGDRLFDIESGMVAGWYSNVRDDDLTYVFPYHPRLVSGEPSIVLGKGSGPDSIRMAAEEIYTNTLTNNQVGELVALVKTESIGLRRELTRAEFALLLERVCPT